jgi:membrane protease YdiL (CAAX protease family)
MNAGLRLPLLAVVVAIGITTAMDASGLSVFSALPLLAVTAIFWLLQRLPRREVGLTVGRPGGYVLAAGYPVVVIGALTLIVAVMKVADPAAAPWGHLGRRMLVNSVAGTLMVLLTEEGFFRGWLWGSLRQAGFSEWHTLLFTSVAFAAWHISAVTLETGFNPPPRQVPLFLINATVLGAIWGLMRAISGSAVVPSLSHAFWNTAAYSLYGFGTKVGALGIRDTSVFGPEVGILGLLLNLLFAAALGAWWRSNRR